MKKKEQKVVLITGASSGIGEATARRLAASGYKVFGTSRSGRAPARAGWTMLPLELASDESVHKCVQAVIDAAGRIDVLFNNAGFGLVGALEETSPNQAQAQMEVFLFGMHRMVRAVLPHMRAQQRGQIINMSSSAATLALPYVGIYAAGKYAMAGYSESLRREVQDFGIAVSYIEASAVRTCAPEELMFAAERIEAYAPVRDRAIRDFRELIRHGRDPDVVAALVQKIIETKRPKLVYRVQATAKVLPFLKFVMPQRAMDAIFNRYARLRGGRRTAAVGR